MIRSTVLACACAVLVAGAGPAAAFKTYTVPAGSMRPALVEGDTVTVAFYGIDYEALARGTPNASEPSADPAFGPQRGDLTAFKTTDGVDYIKRIVGLPGDQIQVKGRILHINDKPVETVAVSAIEGVCEPSPLCSFQRETLPEGRSYIVMSLNDRSMGDDTEIFTVPADHFFMMGDNRDNSNDSRFGVGFVARAALVGEVSRIWPNAAFLPGDERRDGFPNHR